MFQYCNVEINNVWNHFFWWTLQWISLFTLLISKQILCNIIFLSEEYNRTIIKIYLCPCFVHSWFCLHHLQYSSILPMILTLLLTFVLSSEINHSLLSFHLSYMAVKNPQKINYRLIQIIQRLVVTQNLHYTGYR